MTSLRLSACCLVSAFLAGSAIAAPAHEHHSSPQAIRARNLVDSIDQAYDFVIVGGGLAGLVLGARLSEDSKSTVLVLEAGGDGSDGLVERINVPGSTYYNSLWGTSYNWAFTTEPQSGSGGKVITWPRGKGLGGSAAINGLYMSRPGKLEVEAWHSLVTDLDGANNWSWDTFLAAMKKSETFDPPSDEIAAAAGITWDLANHGTSGPIHHSYPGYTFPQVGEWAAAVQNVGISLNKDPYGGQNWGAGVSTSAINPGNWTRSYSRSGYLDPLPPRANYDVLVNAHVSRIIFDSASTSTNLTASAVEYSRDGGKTVASVKVNKEVILAGGTVGSPHVLMNSGVGPRNILTAAGIDVLSELPGVGQNLQDHLAVAVQFTTDEPTMGSVYAAGGPESTDPAYLSFVNSATAHINLTTIVGADGVAGFQSNVASMYQDAIASVPSTDPTVLAGFKAVYDKKVELLSTPTPQVELLLAINSANAVRLTAAIQQSLSTGYIYVNSSNPFSNPVIDPRYLTNPADLAILREGLKIARRIGQAAPYNGFTGEAAPGADVQTDEAWDAWLKAQASTEFHPTGTCSMLPRSLGGVVDANLRIYGIANVRVADASVFPTTFSAHTMAAVYGVGEQASTLIRAYYSNSPSTGGSGNGSTKPGSGSSSGSDGKDAAAALGRPWGLTLTLVTVIAASVVF